MELYIVRHTSYIPDSAGCHGAAFRLLRLSGVTPTAGPLDLLGLGASGSSNSGGAAGGAHTHALDQQQQRARLYAHLLQLDQLNPFLSQAAREHLRGAVLLWLQLCVLEDRLGRLEELAGAGPEYTDTLIKVRGGRRGVC